MLDTPKESSGKKKMSIEYILSPCFESITCYTVITMLSNTTWTVFCGKHTYKQLDIIICLEIDYLQYYFWIHDTTITNYSIALRSHIIAMRF